VFFSLPSWVIALLLFAVVMGACVGGAFLGRYLQRHTEVLREPIGVLQAALLGLVGLILAFGLTLAVGRYEARRAALVAEANAIGTTYLRAQLIAEPERTESLDLLRRYADLSLRISKEVPNSDAMRRTAAQQLVLQRRLWRLAGQAISGAPTASAPRLYVETLNDMIDQETVRISALNNRVPGAVLTLEVVGAAVVVGLLALYLSVLGRGILAAVTAAALVTGLLLVTFDLDRPARGVIKVPATALESVRNSMVLPPAAGPD
jgi:hypothetical protein